MALRKLLNNSSNNTTLTDSLKNNEEYMYAHLIKFERPKLSNFQGELSRKASDYSYITDASYNLEFDDGSVNSFETANGTQTYVANKLLKVGNVSETIQAKASNISITLSGTALGTLVESSLTFASNSITSTTSFIDQGFAEGDTLLLEGTGNSNDNIKVRIDSFSNDNKTVGITPISGAYVTNASAQTYNISVVSEELNGLFMPRNNDYATYLNREVFIYRAHINPVSGEFIGEPWPIFKGIITNGSVKDNVTGDSTVTWSLVSHWGDFVQVNGRLTQDASHRGLGADGRPDLDALVRPEYGSDLGFMHSEKSVNMLATYQAEETRYKMKKRGGLAGWLGGKKVVEYTEMVDRDVDLQFNLSAKYLPVIYGVQKVQGIPIFADALANDSNTVYVAHAICEGEISGIIDVHIDDQSSICINEADSIARSAGSDANVLCAGRADRGDVLAATTTSVTTIDQVMSTEALNDLQDRLGNYVQYTQFVKQTSNFTAGDNGSGGMGLQHEDPYVFTTPIDASMVIHTGKANQRADSRLSEIANQGNFKIQQDFFEGLKSTYWGPSHTLLDTAYTTTKFTIGEGETTIPTIEYVVKGKVIDCYNYDYSYPGTGDQSDFELGDTVTIHKTSDDTQIGSSVQIIDKWSFYNTEGNLQYRFRLSDNPQDSSDVVEFYIKNSSGDKWNMSKPTETTVSTDTVGTLPSGVTASSKQASVSGVQVTLNNPSSAFEAALAGTSKGYVRLVNTATKQIFGTYEVKNYNSSTNALSLAASGSAYNSLFAYATNSAYTYELASHVVLGASAVPQDDKYVGSTLRVTTYDSNDSPTIQDIKVTDYIGSSKIAVLEAPLNTRLDSDSTYSISAPDGKDLRASINPAIQLLDYLTNKRYGKGLDIDRDIDLDSFKQAARDCDTRSKVTVAATNSSSISVGQVYSYSIGGVLKFQGEIESITTKSFGGTTYKEVVFTNVIGKLGYKWSDWRIFSSGELLWYRGTAFTSSASGVMTASVRDSRISSAPVSTLSLTGPGTLTLSVNADGSASSGNPIVKKWSNELDGFTSLGYSLYDSDECPYWAYLGWDFQEQRYVTRHQTNQIIDTSAALFDNINSMLSQFNGMLRYSNGKYSLAVKQAAQVIPAEETLVRSIQEGDIIGELSVSDKGQKDTYNSVTAQIIDPQNKFGGRSITFMNSNYLKQDKGVRRQGNFSAPGITNYYNARINVKQLLDESRFGLKISFKIDQKGYLLTPGSLVELSYSRFNWENRLFRIDNLSYSSDGTVGVTAFEHNDDAYLIEGLTPQGSDSTSEGGNVNNPIYKSPSAPESLSATDDDIGSIQISWTNGTGFNPDTHATEIYVSDDTNVNNSTLLATTNGTSYNYPVSGNSLVTKNFWVKHVVNYDGKKYSSSFVGHEEGSARGSTFTVSVKLQSTTYAISYASDGTSPDPSGAQTLTATAQNFNNPSYRFTVDGTTGNWQTSNTTTFTPATNHFSTPKVMSVEVGEAPASGDPVTAATDSITVTGLKQGLIGASALTVVVPNDSHSLPKDKDGVVTYAGSGTAIYLYEGTTALTYDGVGTADGTWKVTATGTNIDPSTDLTDSGTYVTVGDHSNMTATNATVTYTITGKRADGTAIAISKTQSLSQSVQGIQGIQGITGAGSNFIFRRSATKPDAPTADGLNVPANWEDNAGDTTGTDTLWVSKGSVTAGGTAYVWAEPYAVEGSVSAEVTVFVKNPTNPATKPENENYNFSTQSFPTPNGWSTSAQSLTANGDKVYASSGVATGLPTTTDAAITWGTPFLYAQRTDGDDGADGYSTGVVILYKANTSASTAPVIPDGNTVYTVTSNSVDAGADGWTINKPALTVGQYLWAIQYNFSTQNATVTIATGNWSSPIVVDSNTKGEGGDPGLRTIQGYLYYEKTTDNAPSAPTGNTYTFSSGEVSGTGIGTGENTWTNTPRTQSPTSDNTHYTVRYYGTESSANSTTIDVSYSDVVQYTNFSGVVTFSDGTGRFSQDGTVITTIDGGSIDTGTITANRLEIGNHTIGSTSKLKLYDDALKIFDSGNLRVKLGNLGNTTDE